MHIGIDLGTTFSCVAYVDDNSTARVIQNSDKKDITPSIVYFDGKNAYVGEKANIKKTVAPTHVYEFIKRNIGKPIEIPQGLDEMDAPSPAPYEVNGFKYGAVGMSAIILRKLKKEAVNFFKKIKKIEPSLDEKNIQLDAVITVPAYFGDKERQETKLAGILAGLNVIGIINEPTAAALTYGFSRRDNCKIMVFDLGGGTFDVTLLEMNKGEATVIASDGAHALGGKDWDEVIQNYICSEFYEINNRSIPDEKIFDVQQKALEAKFELSEKEETVVALSMEEGELDAKLYRSILKSEGMGFEMEMEMDSARLFYFDERSSSLISLCRTICLGIMEKANLNWGDLDEIILVGGSCRMPMVSDMLEELSGRKIKKHIEGFNYDTAIAMGAALYGHQKGRVKDVVSHTIGIEYVQHGRSYVEHLIKKNQELPVRVEKRYRAPANAILNVYEGESIRPDECILRGRIELDNSDGYVTIILEADANGILHVTADYAPQGRKTIQLVNDLDSYDKNFAQLREKIQAITINL